MNIRDLSVCRRVAGMIVALGLIGTAAGSASAAPVKVAVYRGMDAKELEAKLATVPQKGVMLALKESPDIAADYIDDFEKATLDKYDVLVLCQTGWPGAYKPATWADTVRAWVREGHGLLVTHDAVGYRDYPALFPEIAVGVGNPYEDQEPYVREWCVSAAHPVSRGFNPRERFVISFYDTITMEAGDKGTVVMRCVDKTFGKNAMSGAPALVCGMPGKGRYIANGAYIGALAPDNKLAKPLGGERKALLNSIAWLGGSTAAEQVGADMGRGVDLGAKDGCPVDPEIPVVDRRGLQGITCESVLAGCEIKEPAKWNNALKQPALEIKELAPGSVIPLDERSLGRPLYNPTPAGWPEVDLCGTWKINKLKGTETNPENDPGTVQGFWKTEYDDTAWKERTVPSHWASVDQPVSNYMAGYGRGVDGTEFKGVGWYRRTVVVPESFKGRRVLLNFGGVDASAVAYVNGAKVGALPYNCGPYEFDITDVAKVGQTNVLAVRVFDCRSTRVDDFYWSQVGGIYDRVKLRGAPSVYVKELRLNPRLKDSTLEVDAVIQNTTGAELKTPLVAELSPDPDQTGRVQGQGKASSETLAVPPLKPGENTISFTVAMKDPVLWTGDNPFLYFLHLKAGQDVIGKERFGFREFQKQDRFLYLNNERVYLRGVNLQGVCLGGFTAIEVFNAKDSMRRALLALKSMGMNNVFPHGTSTCISRTFYDVCDEIGMMVCDWTGFGFPTDGSGQAWLYARYNHPSLVMITLWNEMRDANMASAMNAGYDAIKKLDKQNRPVCTTGGANPVTAFIKTDVGDVHLYPGTIGGHPLDMAALLRYYNECVWRYYGTNIPVSNYEMSGSEYGRYFGRDNMGATRLLLTNEPAGFRQAMCKTFEGVAPGYEAPLDLRWIALYGVRRFLVQDRQAILDKGITNEPAFLDAWDSIRQRWSIKGAVEGCRRVGDLFQGWGYNWYPGDCWLSGGRELIDEPIRLRDSFNEYKRGNNLKYLCFDVFNQNLVSGGKFQATLYVINDQPAESVPWTVRVVVKDPAGKRIADLAAEVGRVPSFKRKLVPIEWDIPEDLAGRCRLEMFLLEGGQVASDNYDSLFVLNRSALAGAIPTAKKIALYDGRASDAERVTSKTTAPGPIPAVAGSSLGGGQVEVGAMRTAGVLDALKIPYTRIETFDTLASYQVLIIGAHGIDPRFDRSGPQIAAWLENGGRLLQLEQALPGRISYLPQLSIVKKYGSALADLIEERHPIFDGIRDPANWERWSGAIPEAFEYGTIGGIYSALIGPMNRTVLASGVMLIPRESNKAVQMLVAEVKVGKGVALLSQAEAVRRYGTDSVATKYVQNLLKHIVSDETRFADTLPLFEVTNLDPHRCGYMELTNSAKTAVTVSADWLKTVTNGFERLSGLPFQPAAGKALVVDKAAGPVELDMAISRLMFPEWEAEKRKKDTDQLGLATDKSEAIFFLHRAEGVAAKEILGRYMFVYKDGTQAEEPIVEGINIGVAGSAPEMASAMAVGEGFYAARWTNPMSEKPLRRIVVEVTHPKARLTVLGITGYLVRNKVHD